MFSRRTALACALLLGFAGLLPAGAAGAPSPTNGTVRVGDMAPDFSLRAMDGSTLCLTDCLGQKPILVIFWSYFCFPCQREMPVIQELYEELGDDLGVISICLDGPEYDNKVLPFLKSKGITFPTAYDRQTEEFFEVAERYGVVGPPTSFLLDASGRVRFIHLGRLEREVLTGVVRSVRDPSYCAEILKPTTAQKP